MKTFAYRWTGEFGAVLPDHSTPEGQTVVAVPGKTFETTTEIDTEQIPQAELVDGTKGHTRRPAKTKTQKPDAPVIEDPVDGGSDKTDAPADDADPNGAPATDSTDSPEA